MPTAAPPLSSRKAAMDPLETLLQIYRSDDPDAAFDAMASTLASRIRLHCAVYVIADGGTTRNLWPRDAELTPELLDAALHVIRPEIFPLGSEFPFDSGRYTGAEMLLLPLHRQKANAAACILIAEAGAFGEDPQPWAQLASAIEEVESRHRRLIGAEERCEDLLQRVEETEALHTLGLAANRTLDQDEVLNLVARFSRTLLGAHYVTVSTAVGGRIGMAASVGLRNPESSAIDDHLARAVLEMEKPLVIDAASDTNIEDYPFHADEGMRVGLGIPLSLFGDTFGSLIVGYRSDYTVTAHDTRLALTLAGHAAVAISNARLHERVEQRSEELEAAYRGLNEATQAKERFFASINHELRNPLGAIIGYHSLLLEGTGGELPEKALGYLKKANRSADTLRTLVNDLLDLSKIAAGKMEVNLRSTTVGEVLDRALNTIQPLAAEKGIPLTMPESGGEQVVFTDPDRAAQILVNLLSNAVKFTERGEVRLAVRSSARGPEGDEEDRGWVDLVVSDTGPGIPSEELERVFEEFQQVHGTRGGTGLGLPISRRLATQLGGDLQVESEVGRGSTFTLRLPRTAAEPAEASKALQSSVPESHEAAERADSPSS